MVLPNPNEAYVLIAVQDAEVSDTLSRMCLQIGIAVYTPPNTPVDKPILCELRGAEGGLIVHSKDAMFEKKFSYPLYVHTIREALVHCVRHLAQRAEEMLMLGSNVQMSTAHKQISTLTGTVLCELTQKETQLLAYLHRAGEHGANRDTLLAELWQYHPDAQTHTLDAHLYRLRQKLAELNMNEPIEIIVSEGKVSLAIKKPHT